MRKNSMTEISTINNLPSNVFVLIVLSDLINLISRNLFMVCRHWRNVLNENEKIITARLRLLFEERPVSTFEELRLLTNNWICDMKWERGQPSVHLYYDQIRIMYYFHSFLADKKLDCKAKDILHHYSSCPLSLYVHWDNFRFVCEHARLNVTDWFKKKQPQIDQLGKLCPSCLGYHESTYEIPECNSNHWDNFEYMREYLKGKFLDSAVEDIPKLVVLCPGCIDSRAWINGITFCNHWDDYLM